jgi:hypothetical protein
MNEENKDLQENQETSAVETSQSDTSTTETTKDKKSKAKKEKKSKGDKPKKEKKTINTKALKYGTLATVFTAIVTAIVIVVNLIAQTVTEKYDLTFDLTDDDIFKISQDTIDYLTQVDEKVQIIVLAEKSLFEDREIYYKQASEVIQKYALYNDNITVEYIDMNSNPNYVSKFKDLYQGDLTEGEIVVYREGTGDDDSDRIKVLSLNDMFTTSTDSTTGTTSVTQSNAEQVLTSAVMYVTDANPKKAVLVTSDMPQSVYYAANSLLTILDSNGYDLDSVDLLTDDLDIESTDLLLILSPLNDFNKTVIDKISDFLYNDGNLGKNVLYMANYDQNSTSNIDEFLEEWGLSVGDYYIAEGDSAASQTVNVYGLQSSIKSSIGVIANDDYADMVTDTTLPIAVPVSRPIEILWENNGDRETTSILTTPDTSALVPLDADSTFDISTAVTGAQNVVAMGSKYIYNDSNEKVTSNVLVFGSAFMSDIYITQDTSYNNGEFILNCINKTTGKSEGITIVPKSLSISTIQISEAQYTAIRNVVVFLIPLLVVVIGIVVYVKRRNK